MADGHSLDDRDGLLEHDGLLLECKDGLLLHAHGLIGRLKRLTERRVGQLGGRLDDILRARLALNEDLLRLRAEHDRLLLHHELGLLLLHHKLRLLLLQYNLGLLLLLQYDLWLLLLQHNLGLRLLHNYLGLLLHEDRLVLNGRWTLLDGVENRKIVRRVRRRDDSICRWRCDDVRWQLLSVSD